MPPLDEADGKVPQLARTLRGKGDDRAGPKRGCGGEAQAVLGLVPRALGRVSIETYI
jgi:hypothetical protein